MTARDDILAGTWQQDPDPKAQALALSGLLARYAHELAEQIRAERDAANIPGSPATPDIIRGMGDAADLIDPEVQS